MVGAGVAECGLRGQANVFRLLWASAVLAVLWGSLTPVELPLAAMRFGDKAIHAGAYLLLTVLGAASLPGPRGRLAALLLMVGLGWGIEGLQSLVPGRDCSLWDALANVLGGLWGYLWAPWLLRLFRSVAAPG